MCFFTDSKHALTIGGILLYPCHHIIHMTGCLSNTFFLPQCFSTKSPYCSFKYFNLVPCIKCCFFCKSLIKTLKISVLKATTILLHLRTSLNDDTCSFIFFITFILLKIVHIIISKYHLKS